MKILLMTIGFVFVSDAISEEVKWRNQPQVLSSNESVDSFNDDTDIDIDSLRRQYVANKKPIILLFKGKELSTEISDWSSNKRLKLSQNVNLKAKNFKNEKAELSVDNRLKAEVEINSQKNISDTGYISEELNDLLVGLRDAFKTLGVRQVSFSNILRRQQLKNESEENVKRESDITKIEFDAIENQSDWLITTVHRRNEIEFQVIDSKSGIILTSEIISDSLIKGFKFTPGKDGYEEVAIHEDYQQLGYIVGLNLIKGAITIN